MFIILSDPVAVQKTLVFRFVRHEVYHAAYGTVRSRIGLEVYSRHGIDL